MPQRPLVLVHGYSDTAKGFQKWVELLLKNGYEQNDLRVVDYRSLTNELTIKDLGEGLDRALSLSAGLADGQEFDAIVHSTGGLVIRTWLVGDERRRRRLKRLVMLAPANFGSPMAHKGRSTLGAVFKGEHEFGPDFMEAGDRILSELELGSAFSWDLAMKDLFVEEGTDGTQFYGSGTDTPYAFVCIGNKDYGILKRIVTEPGTDGTVRWSGCGLNCRRINVDLTRDKTGDAEDRERITIHPWVNDDLPLLIADGLNHGTIMGDPSDDLVGMVLQALEVDSPAAWQAWRTKSAAMTKALVDGGLDQYQQFVLRTVDERGDPVPDYHIEFLRQDGDRLIEVEFAADVHPFMNDTSYRCFHINLSDQQPERLTSLFARVIASSGTAFVGYHGVGSHRVNGGAINPTGKWDAEINLTSVLRGKESDDAAQKAVTFFFPFTTTLIEIRISREPEPLVGECDLLRMRTADQVLAGDAGIESK